MVLMVSKGPLKDFRVRRVRSDRELRFNLRGPASKTADVTRELLNRFARGQIRSVTVVADRSVDFFPASLSGYYLRDCDSLTYSPEAMSDMLQRVMGNGAWAGRVSLSEKATERILLEAAFARFAVRSNHKGKERGFLASVNGELVTLSRKENIIRWLQNRANRAAQDISNVRTCTLSGEGLTRAQTPYAITGIDSRWVAFGDRVKRRVDGIIKANSVHRVLSETSREGILREARISWFPIGGMTELAITMGAPNAVFLVIGGWDVSEQIARNIQHSLTGV